MGGRGAKSGAKRSSSGANAAKVGGGVLPIDNGSANAPQYKMAVDSSTVKKYEFESVEQVEQYANQFYSSGKIPTYRTGKAFEIEDSPIGKDTAVVRVAANRNEAANFLGYLKNNLNVHVEQWGNDSWFVHYKRDSSGLKKPKAPKQKKK